MNAYQQWPTGSAYIGSNREPQDVDVLEFVHPEDKDARVAQLLAEGHEMCGVGYVKSEQDKWDAYRRGNLNTILCWCPAVYLRWVAFTELALRMSLTEKVERIELCKAVLEGDPVAAQNITHLPGIHDFAWQLTHHHLRTNV